jgi:hypothetical protein
MGFGLGGFWCGWNHTGCFVGFGQLICFLICFPSLSKSVRY